MPRKLIYDERVNLFLTAATRKRLQAVLLDDEREVEAIRAAIEALIEERTP
jgi:hypothetical protein